MTKVDIVSNSPRAAVRNQNFLDRRFILSGSARNRGLVQTIDDWRTVCIELSNVFWDFLMMIPDSIQSPILVVPVDESASELPDRPAKFSGPQYAVVMTGQWISIVHHMNSF